jgi:hypothetical protein
VEWMLEAMFSESAKWRSDNEFPLQSLCWLEGLQDINKLAV